MTSPLLPVSEALARLLKDAGPVGTERLPIAQAAGRVLTTSIKALRTQPPFDASAMDGYAVRAGDVAAVPARLSVIGAAPAGQRFAGRVGPGQAVRIFTGAPLPEGADAVVLQEDTEPPAEGEVEVLESIAAGRHIRRAGLDFTEGEDLLEARRVLDAAAISLAAAANHPTLEVFRKPLVAVLATGDELLPPGSQPGPDQIIASNGIGVAAVARGSGADILDLGIAPDDRAAIAGAVHRALDAGADILVTLGGASVGEHDLVREVLTGEGMALDFWKIAMRPGKPLMFGRFRTMRALGLPGNPVSSLVGAHIFLAPLIARLAAREHSPDIRDARLGKAMAENDSREDYVRAVVEKDDDGFVATAFDTQDSSMLKNLARANGFIIRPPRSPAAAAGGPCRVMMIR
jgi:molybdopterin molybdotransferase